MDFDKVIKERHSVRNFKTTKDVDWRKVIEAIEAANRVPFAGNISSIRFVFVTEPEKIAELTEACQQRFVADAKYIVVVCSDEAQVKRSYDERGEMYLRQEAGAAIENFLLKITELGLASCWVGAFSDESVKEILRIPDNIKVEALLPVGYEMGKAVQRKKSDLDRILYFNKWKEKRMVPARLPEAG